MNTDFYEHMLRQYGSKVAMNYAKIASKRVSSCDDPEDCDRPHSGTAKMRVILTKGNETLEFPSQAAAARAIGVNPASICHALNRQLAIHGWKVEKIKKEVA
jgi:hypothetical protein